MSDKDDTKGYLEPEQWLEGLGDEALQDYRRRVAELAGDGSEADAADVSIARRRDLVPDDPDPVYDNTVDNGRFRCTVARRGEYVGLLTVTDTGTATELVREEVMLRYGAVFGPDVEDVSRWQERAISAIDAYLGR